MLLVQPRALAFRMAYSGRVPQRSARLRRASRQRAEDQGVLCTLAPRTTRRRGASRDAKTQAILSSLQAQAAAARAGAGRRRGQLDIDMGMW